jgi:hypothetical protein
MSNLRNQTFNPSKQTSDLRHRMFNLRNRMSSLDE